MPSKKLRKRVYRLAVLEESKNCRLAEFLTDSLQVRYKTFVLTVALILAGETQQR